MTTTTTHPAEAPPEHTPSLTELAGTVLTTDAPGSQTAVRWCTFLKNLIIESGTPARLSDPDSLFARRHRRNVAANSWRIAPQR
ncbi:hypothetical protein [Mycolicibacter heraklionensis]|uniref:hypothetical protein n=1 Tax=Mycolicibacter heraklionensis TaxID=512402 RepID=UPI0010425259|nr:hypothetical protein [Mycolicibacter heraklionensis]